MEHVIVAAKVILAAMIPREPADAKLLYDRRQYVKDMLLIGKDDPDLLPAEYKKGPLDIDMAKLTTLTDASEEWNAVDHRHMNLNLCSIRAAFEALAEDR